MKSRRHKLNQNNWKPQRGKEEAKKKLCFIGLFFIILSNQLKSYGKLDTVWMPNHKLRTALVHVLTFKTVKGNLYIKRLEEIAEI